MTREQLIKALEGAKRNNLSIGECWNLMDAAADMLEADGAPVGIPADVLDAAKSMQSNDYRGPLAWARKVIDFVADYTAHQNAIQAPEPQSFRPDYPTSEAVLGAEIDKAREDEKLFGVGFCVNGWNVPASTVSSWGVAKNTAIQERKPLTPSMSEDIAMQCAKLDWENSYSECVGKVITLTEAAHGITENKP